MRRDNASHVGSRFSRWTGEPYARSSRRVLQHVREKFSCRSCDAITQPPAPHTRSRGGALLRLLAEIAFGKFCLHLPLHRQSRAFAREGVEIDVSTIADWMGAVSVALKPLGSLMSSGACRTTPPSASTYFSRR